MYFPMNLSVVLHWDLVLSMQHSPFHDFFQISNFQNQIVMMLQSTKIVCIWNCITCCKYKTRDAISNTNSFCTQYHTHRHLAAKLTCNTRPRHDGLSIFGGFHREIRPLDIYDLWSRRTGQGARQCRCFSGNGAGSVQSVIRQIGQARS